MSKKYSSGLQDRVKQLREGLEPQPLSVLWHIDLSLRDRAAKLRRVLSGKVFPGDEADIQAMEAAKAKLMSLR